MKRLIAVSREGYGVLWIEKPIRCFCGRAVHLVVNRDGKSRCVVCDLDYRNSQNKLSQHRYWRSR